MITQLIIVIAFIVLNALAIIGFNRATDYELISDDHPQLGIDEKSKMIFWKFRYWCIKYLGSQASKAICTCPPCMSSIHSTYFFLFFFYVFGSGNGAWFMFYPMYVLSLCGFVYTLNIGIHKLEI